MEDLIEHPSEGLPVAVHKPKGSTIHSYSPLLVFENRFFVGVFLANPDIVVSGPRMSNLLKRVFPCKSLRIDEIRGSGGDIHDGEFIEPTVIMHDFVGFPSFFFDCEGWGSVTGQRCDDVAFLQVVLQVLIEGLPALLGS